LTDVGGCARLAAWRVLEDFEVGRVERVGEAVTARRLPARDAALARELVLGAVRYRALYDALADAHLRPGPQPSALRNALRIVAHQLFGLDRVPPHAAVATGVGVLQGRDGRYRGVANAVARKLTALRLDEPEPGVSGPLARIARTAWPRADHLRHSLPAALVRDLAPVLGEDSEAALGALNRVPPLCTRTRPGIDLADHPAMLRRDGPWAWWSDPVAAVRSAVEPGYAVVQDRAQARLLEVAEPGRGEWVADVCAAPGGKARWLRDAGCRVVAGDVSAVRLERLREDGLPVLRHDARRGALAAGGFDLVVADVPCSNSGVLARRPEARWRYAAAELAGLVRIQAAILRGASDLVATGGRLLYTTCSLAPRENRRQVEGLNGWRIVSDHLHWPDGWSGGGYAALLERG